MRFIINVVLLLVAALGLAAGAMFLASELGGEVVGLRSFDAETFRPAPRISQGNRLCSSI